MAKGEDGSSRDRARGALVGLACGDAVGTTVEFEPPGKFDPVTDMVGGGPFDLAPGQWTDDTSMALCLAESIADRGGLDLADQLRRYLLWWREGYLSSKGRCFDIGNTTRAQLSRYERTGEPVDSEVNQEAAANGSLMRLAAVPIAWHRDLAEAAQRSGESSRSTHAARRPVDCCRLYGAMTAGLISGLSIDEVLSPSFWRWGELHPEVAVIAEGSYRDKEPPAIRGTGYCVDALEAALWAVNGAADFRDAVLRAVNLGNDADTTGAIAGQLAGARWGMEAIPAPWRLMVAMGTRITSLADACFDLEADAPADAEPWRHDELIHAYWVEPGRILAGEYPGNPAGTAEKVEVLLDAGIRTFVDLTRTHDGLTAYDHLLMNSAARRKLDVRHISRPIPDMGTTSLDEYAETVQLIRAEADEGRIVYLHCWGGLGRTGTVAGCLVADGAASHHEVLDRLAALRTASRKGRTRVPQTAQQVDVIAAWIRRGQADV